MLTKKMVFILSTVGMVLLVTLPLAASASEEMKVSITDRTGERWDLTQAASIGFKPEYFQYGIGRDTIRPLGDAEIRREPRSWGANPRVIAINRGNAARAYSVSKLARHEIANSRIKGKMIAAAY